MKTRITVSDRFPVQFKREITDEGYLIAPGTLARCGVQVYTRGELQLDGDPSAPFRLMREAEDVMDDDSLSSFENKPITMGHPSAGVQAATWKQLAVGEVVGVHDQGDGTVGATIVVKDAAAVRAILDGKVALSNGYSFDLELTPGVGFDGYQRHIVGNHVAVVDAARGGPGCKIGDQLTTPVVDTLPGLVEVDGVATPSAGGTPVLFGEALQRHEGDASVAIADGVPAMYGAALQRQQDTTMTTTAEEVDAGETEDSDVAFFATDAR